MTCKFLDEWGKCKIGCPEIEVWDRDPCIFNMRSDPFTKCPCHPDNALGIFLAKRIGKILKDKKDSEFEYNMEFGGNLLDMICKDKKKKELTTDEDRVDLELKLRSEGHEYKCAGKMAWEDVKCSCFR